MGARPPAVCTYNITQSDCTCGKLTSSCLRSIISFGQAGEALLVKSSPVQTSAAELLSDLANSTVILPLAFANVSSVRLRVCHLVSRSSRCVL